MLCYLVVSEFILRLPIVIGMADHDIAPIPIGAKFKNFPYHMGDSVEIKKIQSSKSKVQNKFCHGPVCRQAGIPFPRGITLGGTNPKSQVQNYCY
jgi:hypothetical protein